jgi:RNA polymerase sigma factor (sigma-70 family)
VNQGEFQPDELLLIALRKGEPKAYEQIYRESLLTILTFVHLNSGQEEDAKDLLQEAIIVLFEKLQNPNFILTCKVTTYLYSICRNKWLNKLRGGGGTGKNSTNPKRDVNDVHEYLDIPDIVGDDAQIELEEKLKQAFNHLDYICQAILVKFYFYNQTLEEIAKAINFSSANAVKVRKFRCLQKLKEIIKY